MIGFYKHNYLPRYANLYGMELYPFNINCHDAKLGHAYGDYSKGLFRTDRYEFDDEGVFVFLVNGVRHYNPCGVAEYALVEFGNHLLNPAVDKHIQAFDAQIQWLMAQAKELNCGVVWYYEYPNQEKFISGISQGMIISTLLRAYQRTKQQKYLDFAWGAYRVLITPIENGGVLRSDEKYNWWYEEYLTAPLILNGHIYSLLGVWDLFRVTKDEDVRLSFIKGVEDIKNNISKFDMGFYTKYDAFTKEPSNNSYHYTHITLFRILFNITNDEFFNKFANKFQKYHDRGWYRFLNFNYLLYRSLYHKFKRK